MFVITVLHDYNFQLQIDVDFAENCGHWAMCFWMTLLHVGSQGIWGSLFLIAPVCGGVVQVNIIISCIWCSQHPACMPQTFNCVPEDFQSLLPTALFSKFSFPETVGNCTAHKV